MGMGYAGAYADVIEDTSIKKLCKNEFEIFMGCIDSGEINLEEFARNAEFNLKDYSKDLVKAYMNLCLAFEKATGLTLGLAYHDSESEGDRYDDVDGIYWHVDGMYQLTPAGKKMKKYIKRKNFVQFG